MPTARRIWWILFISRGSLAALRTSIAFPAVLVERIPEPIRARLRPVVLPAAERARRARWLLRERILWGGRTRERILVRLLRAHYASLFRRQWSRVDQMPHFFDHRIGSFGLFAGDNTPFAYYRGYYAAEVLKDGDRASRHRLRRRILREPLLRPALLSRGCDRHRAERHPARAGT
jgi:hypothetical protein